MDVHAASHAHIVSQGHNINAKIEYVYLGLNSLLIAGTINKGSGVAAATSPHNIYHESQ